MGMTPQDVADWLEIQELIGRYCHRLDAQDWAGFRALFTADARFDYAAFGGIVGGLDALVDSLRATAEGLAGTLHIAASIAIDLDGDRATARSAGLVPLTVPLPEGGHVAFIGLWYQDELARTAEGWRFASRRQERAFVHNLPAGMTL